MKHFAFKLTTVLCLIIVALLNTQCTKDVNLGPVSILTQDIASFDKLDIESLGEFELRVGPVFRIEVETHQHIHDEMQIQVVNETLEVTYNESLRNSNRIKKFNVIITAPTFREISVDGVLNMFSNDPISNDLIDIHLDGVGNITLRDLAADELNVRLDGVGDIELGGSAISGEIVLKDVGNIKAFDLQYDSCRAVLKGVGDIKVSVNDYLDATLSGVGDIIYDGKPTIVKDVSGQGDVRQR